MAVREVKSGGKVFSAVVLSFLVSGFSAACPAALALFSISPQVAQGSTNDAAPAAMTFSYRFENARFFIPLIELDLDPQGSGAVRFKRGESDDIIDINVKLLPRTLARIHKLISDTHFLTSNEEYQSKKDFSHMGWITISAQQGASGRKVRFNYTANMEIKELADIFRAVATQQIHLFDLELSQQHQPLNLPAELEALENDLRLERVAEPEQLLGTLREIAAGDTVLTTARNLAARIISGIEKGKFKSPVKK